MKPLLRCVTTAVGAMTSVAMVNVAQADVWVFEPTAAIDQRFDDNYELSSNEKRAVSATRAVGTLGLSRESTSAAVRAFLRADALLSISEGDDNDDLSSNQIAFIETKAIRPRSSYGVRLSFKRDTPNRDISADITDPSATAADTGASVTQDQNVDRNRFVINPVFSYNLSRRAELDLDYSFTSVDHGLPSCQEAEQRFVDNLAEGQVYNGEPFTALDELDNFQEHAFKITGRYSLSPIDSVFSTFGYSLFEAEEEVNTPVFEEKTFDERCQNRNVLRNPRDTSSVDTVRLSLGYERAYSQTLTLSGQFGAYQTESDRIADPITRTRENISSTGFLVNASISKTTGLTRYTGRIGYDVFPSDIGDVVESLELIGDLEHKLGQLLDFSFRIRAYEPETVSTESVEFARRFLSMEPKLIWRFSRQWTAAASYRYRRQKSQGDFDSAASNAVLFSIKYTPPSEIADTRGRTQ